MCKSDANSNTDSVVQGFAESATLPAAATSPDNASTPPDPAKPTHYTAFHDNEFVFCADGVSPPPPPAHSRQPSVAASCTTVAVEQMEHVDASVLENALHEIMEEEESYDEGDNPLIRKAAVNGDREELCMLEVSQMDVASERGGSVAEPTPFPWRRFAALAMVLSTNSVFITSLFPFLKFYVVDLGISEESSGMYVGMIAAGFMIGRALASMCWGKFADKHGRKPAIMISLVSTIIFAPLFGLPYNVFLSFAIRVASGMSNCLIGVGKVIAAELAPPEHQARAMSVVAVSWGSGNIMGPAFGGWLAGWDIPFPYLPPMLLSTFMATVALICAWKILPETLDKKASESVQMASTYELVSHKLLRMTLALYCVWSLQSIASQELYNIWGSTEVRLGGLGLNSSDLGTVQSISGACVLGLQLFAMPTLSKRLGLRRLCIYCLYIFIPLQMCMPLLRFLPGVVREDGYANSTDSESGETVPVMQYKQISGGEKVLLMAVNAVLTGGMNSMSSFVFTLQFIFINNSVRKHNRASAQGMAMAVASVFKSIGPFLIGVIFSWSIREHRPFLLGYPLGWVFLTCVACSALVVVHQIPEQINQPPDESILEGV